MLALLFLEVMCCTRESWESAIDVVLGTGKVPCGSLVYKRADAIEVHVSDKWRLSATSHRPRNAAPFVVCPARADMCTSRMRREICDRCRGRKKKAQLTHSSNITTIGSGLYAGLQAYSVLGNVSSYGGAFTRFGNAQSGA